MAMNSLQYGNILQRRIDLTSATFREVGALFCGFYSLVTVFEIVINETLSDLCFVLLLAVRASFQCFHFLMKTFPPYLNISKY